MSDPKDKIKIEFNPLTGKFDLVREFNADRILTHELTPAGNPLMAYDTVTGTYYAVGHEIVIDNDGNVVTI